MQAINRGKNLFFWILILLLLIFPVISIGDSLGLYLDAVNPDYAATQILNPQEFSDRWFVSWPFLTQIYHGTVNTWISALIIMLCGTTSVVQHRLINSAIIFCILLVIDKLSEEYKINIIIRRAGIMFISVLPTVLSICLTQFYIELPGTLCIAAAVLLLSKKHTDKNKKNLYCYTAFVLLGVAFYSYFNFLMFFPGILLLVLLRSDNKLETFILACFGFLLGGCPYVLGYIKMYMGWAGYPHFWKYAGVAFVLFIFLAEAGIWASIVLGKTKTSIVISGCSFVLFIMIILLIKDPVILCAKNLNVLGSSVQSSGKVQSLMRNYYSVLSGSTAERIMFGRNVARWQKAFPWLFAFVTVIYLSGILLKKIELKHSVSWMGLTVLMIYLLGCAPFVNRMQPQHFIPLAFWTFATGIFEIDEIFKWVTANRKSNRFSIGILLLISAVIIGLNSFDRYKVTDEIITTGGTGLYSRQINVLAEEALGNLRAGKREAYIFPEWGFMCGFDYITNNRVAYSSALSEETLEQFIQKGYTPEIVYWNDEYLEDVLEILEDIGIDVDDEYITEYIGNDGEVDFYKLEVQK